MTRERNTPASRTAVCAALTAAVVVSRPSRGPGAGSASAAAAAPRPVCVSHQSGLAGKLSEDIAKALRGRSGSIAISLRDHATHTRCTLRANQRFDSASVVKATVLGTLLWDAQRHHRPLTKGEKTLAKAMITKSDNASTSKLWKKLKATRVKAFLRAAGMDATVPGENGYWASPDHRERPGAAPGPDHPPEHGAERRLPPLHPLAHGQGHPRAALGHPCRCPGRGADPGEERLAGAVHARLAGAQHRRVTGGGRDYTLTVLTQDNRTMKAGVATIEAVARAVHKDLNPAAPAAATVYAPTDRPQEALPAVPKD
ncbi:Beta-lactamase class A catalytic domain-containing protein OS=Streptomyces antimycoticus OX=68175 GN=SANT12839_078530 PE=4 SV=1 [Streptomyces antimycoticus]